LEVQRDPGLAAEVGVDARRQRVRDRMAEDGVAGFGHGGPLCRKVGARCACLRRSRGCIECTLRCRGARAMNAWRRRVAGGRLDCTPFPAWMDRMDRKTVAVALAMACGVAGAALQEFGLEGMGVVATPHAEVRASVGPDGQRS